MVELTTSRTSTLKTSSHRDMAREVQKGLYNVKHKSIPCRFLYDERGSQLFEDICSLPEYYVTRSERRILDQHAHEIIEQSTSSSNTLAIELGSGSSVKTRILIEQFIRQHGSMHYIPIDISPSILEESTKKLEQSFPGIHITGVVSDYEKGLRKVNQMLDSSTNGIQHNKLIMWLGGSVGNFTTQEAVHFLCALNEQMAATDRLLIGIDLRKDAHVLEAAYDDAQGVTADFNMNILHRMNRELGANFNLDQFKHRAIWNDKEGRIEMHLVSQCQRRVELLDECDQPYSVSFEEGEMIHTENSYKYSLEQIQELAKNSGFEVGGQWFDPKKRFSLNLFVPMPSKRISS